MAKKLTRFILLALVLGIIAGWAINAAIDDGTPGSTAQLKQIAEYLSIVTALFLRLIKMIIAPSRFLKIIDKVRCARLPKLFASSIRLCDHPLHGPRPLG